MPRIVLQRALVLVVLLCAARPTAAQRVLGPGEDASVLARGALRMGVGTQWAFANEHFGRDGTALAGKREALGADFTFDSLTPSRLEWLHPLRLALVPLLGASAPVLTAGQLRTNSDVGVFTTPLTIEVGLTNRLTLGAVVPYVKTRNEITLYANSPPGSANVGVNPGRSSTTARDRNQLVVGQVTTATQLLAAELARCAKLSDPSCSAVNADRAGALALVARGTSAAATFARVYGTRTQGGALFAPLGGSALQTAVHGKLDSLATAFRTYLGAPNSGTSWISDRPVAAAMLAANDLQRVLADTAFGVAAVPFETVERSHLGDIDLGGKLLLYDGFGAQVPSPLDPGGVKVRLAVAGWYRLPIAQRESPDDFADIGTGDSQPDVDVRAYADVIFGRHLWASTIVRHAVQLADRQDMRITDAPGDPFPAFFRRHTVERNLGDLTEVTVTPRYVANEALAFAATWQWASKSADAYTGTFTVVDAAGVTQQLSAASLDRATAQTAQRVGGAITVSSVRAHRRGRAKWPLEVTFARSQVIAGTNALPRSTTTSIALRYYSRLWGAEPPPAAPRRPPLPR